MSVARKLEWVLLAATAGLMIFLKWLHYGVTHYNIFLLILIGWSFFLILLFHGLTVKETGDGGPEEPVAEE